MLSTSGAVAKLLALRVFCLVVILSRLLSSALLRRQLPALIIMPRYLFAPRAAALDRIAFDSIGGLGQAFKTSLTATAIRLVDLDQFSGFVISHTPSGRKWFARSPSVPRHWFPREDLDVKSFAFGVQFGGRSDDGAPRKVSADAWFDRPGAARFMVREQTVRVARDETVSLVIIDDKGMLEDR